MTSLGLAAALGKNKWGRKENIPRIGIFYLTKGFMSRPSSGNPHLLETTTKKKKLSQFQIQDGVFISPSPAVGTLPLGDIGVDGTT